MLSNKRLFWLGIFGVTLWAMPARSQSEAQRWAERFRFQEPLVESSGVCTGKIGELPSLGVKPLSPGAHLVRVSIPFSPGAFPGELGLKVLSQGRETVPDVRVLAWHPGQPRSARRALITFPFTFEDVSQKSFTLALVDRPDRVSHVPELDASGTWTVSLGNARATLSVSSVAISLDDGAVWQATLIAPGISPDAPSPYPEFIEAGENYLWVRLLVWDAHWPRILEARMDSLGTISVQAHVQRLEPGDGTAPDLGWEIVGPGTANPITHQFTNGQSCTVKPSGEKSLSFPVAHFYRRGSLVVSSENERTTVRYLRCSQDERVPFQHTAWRSAAFVVGKEGHTSRNALLEPEIAIHIDATTLDALSHSDGNPDLVRWPTLDDLHEYTIAATKRSLLVGDDFGNVTSFQHGQPAGVFGMNRLNHCPAIFREAERTGDPELRQVALLWCSNMYDLSLWWGDKEDFGGTRYNNANAAGQKDHEGDTTFMWRTNYASNFCTKGYDSFFYAYEETGDPRMAAALRAQIEYARQFVHTDRGECRNIGDVADFMNLYRCTGVPMYRDEALRLFRELRTKLSNGDLFSQGGQPIEPDPPFINEDARGLQHPFAKPYIIGYALAGLPELLREFPNEPKLSDVVRAVADFLAESQDPAGGWRYPHPKSANQINGQSLEHAAQLCRAASVLEARGESVENLLDAIERMLQSWALTFERTGTVLSGLQGWESAAGLLTEGKTIYDLYQKPADRDSARDYTEGVISIGGAPPEGIVYLTEVLQCYLARRPAERLFHANVPLTSVLKRMEDRRIQLELAEKGTRLRAQRPENPDIGFVLLAPERTSIPTLNSEELGNASIAWSRDEDSGRIGYSLDRPQGTFTASFAPHTDYIE
ncbi:MAG: hypothetical protein HY706_05625, partial [Candidatus Hydrogenedentes bacterium]|nr:hypothetical protein [Candidatus Hydrogenedentota bacterium]